MNICILNASVLAASTLLLTTGTAFSQVNPVTPNETVYSLCSGTCSRSMQVVASFTDVDAAFEAVEKRRQLETGGDAPHIGVFTGKADPWLFHSGSREYLKPVSCSIVLKGIRCGNWSTQGKPMDFGSAELLVQEFRSSGRSAEMIYHFPVE